MLGKWLAKTAESLAAARPALLPRECWAKLRELVVLRFVIIYLSLAVKC